MRHGLLVGLVLCLAIVGCKGNDAYKVQKVQLPILEAVPADYIGTVTAVLEQHNLLAVGNLPLAGIEKGQSFVLMNQKQKVIGAGHVVVITDTSLHLRYRLNEKDIQPQIGDFAVKPQ